MHSVESSSADRASRAGSDLGRLFNEVVRLEIELWNAVDGRLRGEHDLPLPRFEVMQVIARHEACRVHDIASDLVITIGGASKLVDRIEGSGDCRRRSNPSDRRSSIIELTPAGRRALAGASVSFEDELERRLGSALSGRSLQQLTATVTRLRTVTTSAETIGRTD